jgi:branched-chain amino acid transport system permease protein
MAAQDIVNGLLQGGVLAIVALGLSLVFGVLRLVNFAHGALLMAGGYLAYEIQRRTGWDPLLSLAIVVPVVFLLAYPVQRYLLTDLMVRGPDVALVATFGIALVVVGLLEQVFGADSRSLGADYATSGVSFLGLHARVVDLITMGLAVGLVATMHVVLTRTPQGVALRAAAVDPATAGTMGLDIRRIYAVTFAAAAALAAVAGVMIGLGTSLTPDGGLGWLVKGFAVVVLGGIGSPRGTLVAALTLGVVEAVGGRLFGSEYSDLVVYGTFFLALALRPSGLLRVQTA